MDRQIQAGDLVQVIFPSVCPMAGDHMVGDVFQVLAIGNNKAMERPWCHFCGKEHFGHDSLFAKRGEGCWVSVHRLKRIPPYEQLEHFRSQELLRRDVKVKA